MNMAAIVFLIAFLLTFQQSAQQVDRTLEREASGADVVRATIGKIESALGFDGQFLRRIAFVESRDGTNQNTYRSSYDGGIWQVDEATFRTTQDSTSLLGFTSIFTQIMNTFGINWPSVRWSDLRVPLYSALAARLFLLTIPLTKPCDIAGQAAFWSTHYNGAGAQQEFVNSVQTLRQQESCRVNSDIMVVLDSSSSIGSANFNNVREFLVEYVSRLEIGPDDNQVGVIRFSSTAQILFGLNEHTDQTSLQQAIRGIEYTGSGTNIPAGLCQLVAAFFGNSSGARADSSVFRVAIVMTDGRSTRDNNPCNFASVAQASRAVHAVSPRILVFAVGIGNQFDPQDVMNIASGPEFVVSAQSFSEGDLECVQTTQEDRICNSISTPVQLEENSGSLERGEQIRWQFDIPGVGVLFTLRVDKGEVVMYTSPETTAPSEAFHQFKLQTSSSGKIYLNPTLRIEGRNIMFNRTASAPVYMTLEGLGERNTFTLSKGLRVQSMGELMMIAVAFVSSILWR